MQNCSFVAQIDVIATWPENLNYLASTVFEIVLSQDGTIETHDRGFHGNKDTTPKGRHEKILHIRWMVFHENLTSLGYVVCIYRQKHINALSRLTSTLRQRHSCDIRIII